ncbi:MAG: ribbon-helix-helix protein, CopG family [Blastocatellales bacterium]
MATVKTAISIQENLFERIEELARELNISRSQLFARAIEDFIRREENRRITKDINDAYPGEVDPTEEDRLLKMRSSHRRMVEGEW